MSEKLKRAIEVYENIKLVGDLVVDNFEVTKSVGVLSGATRYVISERREHKPEMIAEVVVRHGECESISLIEYKPLTDFLDITIGSVFEVLIETKKYNGFEVRGYAPIPFGENGQFSMQYIHIVDTQNKSVGYFSKRIKKKVKYFYGKD